MDPLAVAAAEAIVRRRLRGARRDLHQPRPERNPLSTRRAGNCAFGLRLDESETIVQEEAPADSRQSGARRRAARDLQLPANGGLPRSTSEHSFANAIDVAVFVLRNGRRVVVEHDWIPASKPATTPAAAFLRKLTRRLYDEQIFSVVLTPSYDKHHRNHLHLDGASYTVDGT